MVSIRKGLRIFSGFLLLVLGGIMAIPGVPGPGIAVLILGLVILSDHFHWARRCLDWAKRKGAAVTDRFKKTKAGPNP